MVARAAQHPEQRESQLIAMRSIADIIEHKSHDLNLASSRLMAILPDYFSLFFND